MISTPLTPEEQTEWAKLEAAYDEAVRRKTEWLDRKMVEHCPLKVGDEIYDLETGRRLGVVTRHYRFWAGQGRPDLDGSYYCDVEYEIGPRMFDNTSRQSGVAFGTREQAAERARWRAERLAAKR